MEQPKPKRDLRGADLAKIHIARKELGLDEEAYRDVLRAVCGVESAKDLDMAGRWKLLQYFRSKGWKDAPSKTTDTTKRRSPEEGTQDAKMLALWLELGRLGKLKNPAEAGLDAYCKRVTGVERREWLTARQAANVIEGLKAWIVR